jgi:hypothetical protein
MEANLTEMEAKISSNNEKFEVHTWTNVIQGELIAKMDAHQEEANETARATDDRSSSRRLAVRHRRQPKKRPQGDCRPRKQLAYARRRLTRRAFLTRRKGRGHKGQTVQKR